MFGHALEDDTGVEGRAFDGGKEFILGSVYKVPTQRDAAQLGIDQHGAVAIVPAQAQEAGLARLVALKALGERGHGGLGAAGDGFKDVAHGGEAGLDAGVSRMHAARDHAADAGNQLRLARHGDDAGGGADDIDHVALADVGADGVPVRVECAHGDGNSGAQAELRGPLRGEMAGQVVAGKVFAA